MQTTNERPWLERNLKWVILAAVLACLLFFVAVLGAIAFVVVAATRSSDVYQTAMTRAQSHPEVVERLGAPIEPGWLIQGRIEVDNRTGEADLSIPVHGPRGEATISVIAGKRGGIWRYEELVVRFDDGASVDLRTPQEASTPALAPDESGDVDE